MKLMEKAIIVLLFTCQSLSGFGNLPENSIFNVSESLTIQAPAHSNFHCITTEDLNQDQLLEIIYVTSSPNQQHIIGIKDNNQHRISEAYDGLPAALFMVGDMNNDDQLDIVTETYPFNNFEVISTDNLEIVFHGQYVFGCEERVRSGAMWRNEDNEIVPIFFLPWVTSFNGRRSVIYEHGRILTGSPVNGEPEIYARICRPESVSFYPRSRNREGDDYFMLGDVRHYYNEDNDDELVEFWHEYRVMFTSYNSNFQNPDSLIFIDYDLTDHVVHDSLSRYEHTWGYHSVVWDFDGDTNPEWIVPWFNETNPDTFFSYITFYNPNDFSLLGEVVIPSQGLPLQPNKPMILKGVKIVDVNQDGIYELLVLIRGEPLYVINTIEMNVIMKSDISMPDNNHYLFELGRFTDNNLQLLVQSDLNELKIYNLPENWDVPLDIKDSEENVVDGYSIIEAFPNPFNSTTKVNYSLFNSGLVNLNLFDYNGRIVANLLSGVQDAGRHLLIINAVDFPSGSYLLTLSSGKATVSQKLILVR